MTLARRSFIQSIAAGSALALGAAENAHAATSAASAPATPDRLPALLPRRLKAGDTIGLISPANATFERESFTVAIESLRALGFKVKEGQHLRSHWGPFGGTDAERAADVNAMFADDSVDGILAMTGGSGCNRIVDQLDYSLIAKKPKFFGGFSDLTCLVNAIQRRTGVVTFHMPVAVSEWNAFSVDHFRALVMDGQMPTLSNPTNERGDSLVQTQDLTQTIRGGRARGRLVGGNLAVLASLAGTPYFPDCRGAILFIEEINEFIYRVDRTLSTLRLSGVLAQAAGIVLGKFTKCEPGDGNYGVLPLDEVFDDYFLPLNVPVYRGAMIGHIKLKFTLPVGGEVEMDADAGTLQVLKPAVI